MLDSIDGGPVTGDTSIDTTAQPNAKEVTPDFSILAVRFIQRHNNNSILPAPVPDNFANWPHILATTATAPLLAELKRPLPRRAISQEGFPLNLRATFLPAMDDLDLQASTVNRS